MASFLKTTTFKIVICVSMLTAICLPAQAKKISISFDDAPLGDGPSYQGDARTDALIRNLKKANTGPVIFFVVTKSLSKPHNRARIKRYAKAGHLIANHSNTHQWAHKTDTDKYLNDIDQAEQALKGFDNRRNWFRFPYLDEGRDQVKSDVLHQGLQKRELFNGYVTIDNYDWYIASKWKDAVEANKHVDLDALKSVYVEVLVSAAEFYNDLALKYLKRSPAHTLLLHENDPAAHFIGDLVTALRAKGWEIIDPDTAYQDPIAKQIPKTLLTGQGRVAALAIDAGADPTTLTHLAIDEKMIDALLLERGVFKD